MNRSTNGINARPHPSTQLLALLFVLWSTNFYAQSVSQEFYKIKVVLHDGQRLYGLIGEMTDSYLTVIEADDDGPLGFGKLDGETVEFSTIKRVIIKRTSRKRSRISGAVIGGLLTGFVAVVDSQRSQFRSSALEVMNITLATGAGALLGMVVGHSIGNTSRVVVRPAGSDPETIGRRMRLKLEPFSYSDRQQLMNAK